MSSVPITRPSLDVRTNPAPAGANRQLRLLRFPAVRARTGLSRSTIWRLERKDGFPRHRRISTNVVAWVEEEVNDWIRSKVSATPEA